MSSRIPLTRASRVLTSSFRPQLRTQCLHRRRNFTVYSAVRAKKYTEDHEWVELSPDSKTLTLGISTYAASALGDVIYVELPSSDLEASAGDAIGAIESVKSASDILTPVDGKVVATNSVLEETPGLVNKDPEGEGWIAKFEVGEGAKGVVEGLMDEGAYKSFTEGAEEH